VIFYLTTTEAKGYYTLWTGKPTLTFDGSYPIWRANFNCSVAGDPVIGWDAMFPKFVMPKGGMKKIEIVDNDDYYTVREIK